jgi:REP element-mobilizing transposase RayT
MGGLDADAAEWDLSPSSCRIGQDIGQDNLDGPGLVLLQSRSLTDIVGRCEPVRRPIAYFITFSCYGTHLHGSAAGSVDRRHNVPGTRWIEPDPHRELAETNRMTAAQYILARGARSTVLESFRKSCAIKGWLLCAAHVRSTHVHLVVSSPETPERVMAYMKHYASRALNRQNGERRRRWTSHGSTRWLWEPGNVDRAIDYVLHQQGVPMAVHRLASHWADTLEPSS